MLRRVCQKSGYSFLPQGIEVGKSLTVLKHDTGRLQMEDRLAVSDENGRPLAQVSAASPVASLLVIRSPDIDRAVSFYRQMGMRFLRHSHGTGPEHYASETCGFVFEIYPQRKDHDTTTSTRFGFQVDNVDRVVGLLGEIGVTVMTQPADTEWGRRAVVRDFDGHTIELMTPIERRSRMSENKAHCSGKAGDAK